MEELVYFKLIHNLTVLFFKIICRAVQRSEKQILDKGLPAPPRGSSEELQHSEYLQIQKCFTLALLVLLMTNIMSVTHCHTDMSSWKKKCEPRNPVPDPFSAKIRKADKNLESNPENLENI